MVAPAYSAWKWHKPIGPFPRKVMYERAFELGKSHRSSLYPVLLGPVRRGRDCQSGPKHRGVCRGRPRPSASVGADTGTAGRGNACTSGYPPTLRSSRSTKSAVCNVHGDEPRGPHPQHSLGTLLHRGRLHHDCPPGALKTWDKANAGPCGGCWRGQATIQQPCRNADCAERGAAAGALARSADHSATYVFVAAVGNLCARGNVWTHRSTCATSGFGGWCTQCPCR